MPKFNCLILFVQIQHITSPLGFIIFQLTNCLTNQKVISFEFSLVIRCSSALIPKVCSADNWGQFHQRSTRRFYVRKLRMQPFCAYILGLYFTGTRLLAQKLPVECWRNWPLVVREISSSGSRIPIKLNLFSFAAH